MLRLAQTMTPKRGPTPDRFNEDGDEMSGGKDLDDEGVRGQDGESIFFR
jgi:hypothetical protein